MEIETIRFKRDTRFRKLMFTGDSFAHPAKMDSQLLLYLVERYTKPAETILDPMFGSGTCMLACTVGRHVIGVELEEKFIKMSQANWERVKTMPQLGSSMGTCTIIHGDARNLSGLLADIALFSPPYAETVLHDDQRRAADPTTPLRGTPQERGEGYNPDNPSNIGNLSYGQIDHILTSPPYEGAVASERSGIDWSKNRTGKAYGDKLRDKSKEVAFANQPGYGLPFAYSKNADNIGNLKSSNYLEAMLTVYQECFKVLRPGGLLILVLKNFIRDRKIVRLDLDTIKLCESCGFVLQERLQRELPSQSFWRILYKKKYGITIDFEDVLVFKRE